MTQVHSDAWVIRPMPNPQAYLRLFCFPYSGGGASVYRTWSGHLPAEVEVCAIELPGRESRFGEPPFTQLPLLVEALAEALDPFLDLPFAFFGHCMGALLSFELARYLRSEYLLHPAHLFISAHGAPQYTNVHEPIHRLPDAEFVKELHRLNGTSEHVLQNAALMEVLIPILKADFTISETYDYREEDPLTCALSAFGGLEDPQITSDDLRAWQAHTTGAFSLRLFPGDHFFLYRSKLPLLQTISQDLQCIVERLK